MTEVVSLRLARKRKMRQEKERRAAENRLQHGVPLAERKRRRTEAERAAGFLDGHRLRSDGES